MEPNDKKPVYPPRGRWTAEEDAALTTLVTRLGTESWQRVAAEIPGRCCKQCRSRWTNQLDPAPRRGRFSTAEDARLLADPIKWGPRLGSKYNFHVGPRPYLK